MGQHFWRFILLVFGVHVISYVVVGGVAKLLNPDAEIPGFIGRALF
jgi:hypothetical protein